jgi:hypothetical protein
VRTRNCNGESLLASDCPTADMHDPPSLEPLCAGSVDLGASFVNSDAIHAASADRQGREGSLYADSGQGFYGSENGPGETHGLLSGPGSQHRPHQRRSGRIGSRLRLGRYSQQAAGDRRNAIPGRFYQQGHQRHGCLASGRVGQALAGCGRKSKARLLEDSAKRFHSA